MRTLCLFICGLFVVLASCDGRDRVYRSNEEVLIQNKLLDSFSENITYFPESYSEVVTDTILSNGLRVKLKVFTDMAEYVLTETKRDTILHKTYHRERKVQLEISHADKVLFAGLIDKDFFNTHAFDQIDELKDTILMVYSFDPFQESGEDLTINFDYYFPDKEDRYYRRELVVNDNGTFEVNAAFTIF